MLNRNLFSVVLLLIFSLLCAPPGAAERDAVPAATALDGLERFTVDAVVVGQEARMLVTDQEIETEMAGILTRAGIPANPGEDREHGVGRLHLTFKAYSVEPVLPAEYDESVRLFPISVYLAASRPMYIGKGDDTRPVEADVWWTHVDAWALERTLGTVACLAVRKALSQFVDFYGAQQTTARVPHTY